MTAIAPSTVIADVMIVSPEVFGDERGRFIETYRRSWFPLGREMVQGNRSDRQQGAVVGLHYHFHQADYWYVTRGRARVVLHDLRIGSPTDGATEILEIGEHDDRGSVHTTGGRARFRSRDRPDAHLPRRLLLQPEGRARRGLGRP